MGSVEEGGFEERGRRALTATQDQALRMNVIKTSIKKQDVSSPLQIVWR